MKCCACPNPAFNNHPRAPLCRPRLEAWRELEDSPRITQKPLIDSSCEAIEDAILAEVTRELGQSWPTLARKIRQVICKRVGAPA